MIIYKAVIYGEEVTIKKVNVKNKQQCINMLNDAVESDSNLYLFTCEEIPYGEIYKGNKKQLKESIKKHYARTNYTSYTITDLARRDSYTITESSQYNG